MTDDVVIRNRARQIEWYGEPLHDRFRRLLDRLRLRQSALAEVLGLSRADAVPAHVRAARQDQ